ncbi:MAG TPA: cupin domain-containing protein [Actinomycetota bacterium]|nr:cupin domain-containing protein [Actinomycetota bacterium]
MNAQRVRLVRPADRRRPAQQTPGMSREEAVAAGGRWVGLVHTEPGMASAWHHHGGHDTYVYVVSGRFRLESGPAGAEVVEAEPGDFLHIPAGAIHREATAGGERVEAVVFRAGAGEVVVNVDGPAPADARRSDG